MQPAIEKFIQYLRYERNASPATIGDYRCDIEQFRDFLTPPGEPTMALDQLDQGLASGIYNLGSERGFSVKEVIHACERVTGRGIPVRWGLRRAGDPARLVASSQKIKKDMGWNPAHSDLETIIETAWRWHRLRFG